MKSLVGAGGGRRKKGADKREASTNFPIGLDQLYRRKGVAIEFLGEPLGFNASIFRQNSQAAIKSLRHATKNSIVSDTQSLLST